jgi:hypothetical protein
MNLVHICFTLSSLIGFRSILDYLFPTPEGFIDILEIKKPTHEVIKEDRSPPGAFCWSAEANEAIGQASTL